MSYISIFFAAACFCLNGVMTRVFQLHTGRRKSAIRIYQAGFCLVGAAAYFFFGGGSHVIRPETLICAVLFGLFFGVAVHFSSECYECGSMSLTSLIMNLSLSIPMLYSFIVFRESITVAQSIGLALLLVTFALSAFSSGNSDDSGKTGGKRSKVSAKWMILLFFAFLANGLTAVIQKQHQFSVSDAGGIFLAIAYFVTAIYFTVLFFTDDKKHYSEKPAFHDYFSGGVELAAVTVASGLGSFIGNGMLNSLSVTVDAAILYPSINGGLAIMTAVVSFILFREKVNRLKLLSIIIGVCAIILLAV